MTGMAAVEYVHGLLGESAGMPVEHDLSDPAHVAYLDYMFRAAGKTPERYPALFARLEQPAAPGAGSAPLPDLPWKDGQGIDYVTPSQGAQPVTRAHGTFTRLQEVAFGVLVVAAYRPGGLDAQAIGARDLWAEHTARVPTSDATALPWITDRNYYATLTWSVEYRDGTREHRSVRVDSPYASNTARDPEVEDPRVNPQRQAGDLNSIVIGLARGFNRDNKDTDYWFFQKEFENQTLLVPLTGSMKFIYPLRPLSDKNPVPLFRLDRIEGGQSQAAAGNYWTRFWIDETDPTVLRYELKAGQNDAGSAISFGRSPWVSNTKTYFTGLVIVQLQGPGVGDDPVVGWSTVMSSDSQDRDPSDGVSKIKPITYVWHCLAAGTQITLAGGGSRAVEDFQVGDEIRTGDGAAAAVLATLAQPHWGPVTTLGFAGGGPLTCSATHPVMTGAGPVQARSLQVGATVRTPAGDTRVTSVTTSEQDGAGLFNLWLDPAGHADPMTFIANGIVVGDYRVQVSLGEEQRRDPERLRADLPAELHQDLASSLADGALASRH